MVSKRCNNKSCTMLRIYARRLLFVYLRAVYASRETSINKQRYTERIRVVVVQTLVVKIYFFSPSIILYLWCFLSYRSHCFNNVHFFKTLVCTVSHNCFLATIHQRHHSPFIYYHNFLVFSKSFVT